MTEIKLVTVHEELASKARNGAAQVVWHIKSTDSPILILRNKTGVLSFLLVRWTPIVFAEQVGIIADAGVVPVNIGQCEECQRGEAVTRQVYIEVPQPEEGFARVYRRLKGGDFIPDPITEFSYFPLKAHAMIHFWKRGSYQVGAYVDFVGSIPRLEPKEVLRFL